MIQVLIILILALFLSHDCDAETVNIISIIDKDSATAALVRTYSIIKSCPQSSSLKFYFLVMDPDKFDFDLWHKITTSCFRNAFFEMKNWTIPDGFPSIKNRNFDKAVIYARFYLPNLFPVSKYIYLDNDLIANGNIHDLFSSSLTISKREMDASRPNTNTYIGRSTSKMYNKRQRYKSFVRESPPTKVMVGFIFDNHPQYRVYWNSNFKIKNPLVQKSAGFRGLEVFLNGGVALVDAMKWRQERMTEKAEALMIRNLDEKLYDVGAAGDQGTFMLLFEGKMAALHPRWNMRRAPAKTIGLLGAGYTGIVHFAGVTHGDSQLLCYEPLRYQSFTKSVVPLYLSILSSFERHCPIAKQLLPYCNVTEAVRIVEEFHRINGSKVVYNPGHGAFKWPPV